MKTAWMEAARVLKKALVITLNGSPKFRLQACGNTFWVTYENRNSRIDRDYPLLQALAQGASCIFDVGANRGITSLIMAMSLPTSGVIYTFEASEMACHVAQENIALNGLQDRVKIINALITEQTGQVNDFYWNFDSAGASMVAGFMGEYDPMRKVSLSLDTFYSQTGIVPDLVKIDVEGSEERVIRGMERLMCEGKPVVEVELHNWKDLTPERTIANLLPLLERVGYKVIDLRTRQEVRDAGVFKGRDRCHTLLLPKGHTFPARLKNLDTSNL